MRAGFRTSRQYSLSVRGGAQALQYFISGQWEGNEGVLPLDLEEKTGIRGTFTFTPFTDLNVQVSTGYTRVDLSNTPAGNNAQGITLNTFRRDRNYLQRQSREAIDPLLDWKITTQIDHFITGLTTTWSPSRPGGSTPPRSRPGGGGPSGHFPARTKRSPSGSMRAVPSSSATPMTIANVAAWRRSAWRMPTPWPISSITR